MGGWVRYSENFMPVLAFDVLTRLCEEILRGAGVPPHKAEVTAACLIAE